MLFSVEPFYRLPSFESSILLIQNIHSYVRTRTK